MSTTNGTFVWYTLLSNDPSASVPFFTQLFGWQGQEMEVGGDTINMMINDGAPFSGVKKNPMPGHPSAWIGYVGVDSVDASVDKIQKMGGKVAVPATDIEPGRFAIVSDPQGAWFAVFQKANDEIPTARHTEAGDFGWGELATSDVDGAQGFYGEAFNWGKGPSMPMDEGTYHMMTLGEEPVMGMFLKPPEVPACFWTHYVNVDDVDATIEKAKGLGGGVMVEATTVPGMVIFAVLTDPTGAAFGVAKSLQ